MKTPNPRRFPATRAAILASACGLLATPVTAATFNWSRGVAGSFSWNNSTGVTAGESAPSGTLNGNWGGAAGTPGTVAGTNFPGVAGDIANLSNAAGGNAQTINLDQNVTIGSISNIGSTNGTGVKTIASGGAGNFILTFNNAAADGSIIKLSTTNSNASTISAGIAINGNGNLVLTNSSTNTLTLSGGITSSLSSGTQTLKNGAGNNAVNGVIGNGSTGGTVAVEVTGGTLSLGAANTYSGATTITAGTLALTGTAGALSTSSAITNNGAFTINRTNAVVQGTDFASAGIGGTGALNATGTGLVLTLNTANTYAGSTTIGAGANNSVLRATASGALGGGAIVFDLTGNGSTARLELSGGITLNNAITFTARNNASAAIQNISGNNTMSGLMTLGLGGTSYTVQSDAGNLALTNSGTSTVTVGKVLTLRGAGDGRYDGVLAGAGGLAKADGGKWTLNGSSTYTGATSVSAGTLLVNGALGSTAVGVTGGTLGGTGSIGGAVSVTGTGSLSAGASIESLATGALSMAAGTTFIYEAANASSTGADLVVAGGTLSLTGVTLDLSGANLAAGSWAMNDKITLISYTGSGITSGFTGFLDDTIYVFGSKLWMFNYDDSTAGSNYLSEATGTSFVTMTVVPEPGVALLGSFGVLALLRRRRS